MNSQQLTVPADAAGARLDAWLGQIEAVGSRSAAERMIGEGLVSVGGVVVIKRSFKLAGGESITVAARAGRGGDPQAPAVAFTIAYEDESVIVVDKPAGLVVHPAAGHRTGTLAQALSGRAAGGEPDRAGIVHRLDKDTSGLLVVAKSDAALRKLQTAIQDRSMRREYIALVAGRPGAKSGTIEAPLGRDRVARERVSIRTDQPRDAVTHFETITELPTSTLLRLQLETGRTHQIRAHLEAIGLSVCGDPQYGNAGAFGLKRQFLHAAKLAFPHPDSAETVTFESPLPPDLEAALKNAAAAGQTI